jgi:hypothetical protein
MLHNVLSRDECLHYMKATETAGYKSLEKVTICKVISISRMHIFSATLFADLVHQVFPEGYRSNERVMIIDPKLSDALFHRIIRLGTSQTFYSLTSR